MKKIVVSLVIILCFCMSCSEISEESEPSYDVISSEAAESISSEEGSGSESSSEDIWSDKEISRIYSMKYSEWLEAEPTLAGTWTIIEYLDAENRYKDSEYYDIAENSEGKQLIISENEMIFDDFSFNIEKVLFYKEKATDYCRLSRLFYTMMPLQHLEYIINYDPYIESSQRVKYNYITIILINDNEMILEVNMVNFLAKKID